MGKGFDAIPMDALGVMAWSNDDPLVYRNTTFPYAMYSIIEKSYDRMVVRQQRVDTHSYASYLGAIVSADRQTIYWVNDRRPLPQV